MPLGGALTIGAQALPFIGSLFGGLFGGGGPSKETQAAIQNLLRYSGMGEEGGKQLLGWLNQLQPQAMNLIGRSNELFPFAQNMAENGQNVGGTAGTFLGGAQSNLQGATNALSPALNYWTSILAGGKEGAQALSPDIQGIQGRYNVARQQLSQYGPRGGGMSAMLASLPFQQARDVSNLYSTLRPQAAGALNQLGGTLGQIGSTYGGIGTALNSSSNALAGSLLGNLMGLGGQLSGQINSGYGNLFNTGSSANNPVLGYDVGNRLAKAQQGGGLGGGIFDILSSLNLGSLMGNKNPYPSKLPGTEIDNPLYGSWGKG